MQDFLLEKTINGRRHYSFCGPSKSFALEAAVMPLKIGLEWGHYKEHCSPETASGVIGLIEEGRHEDAIAAWNDADIDPHLTLYEIEFLAMRCHHAPINALAREDIFYTTDLTHDGHDRYVALFGTNFAALEFAASFLRDWTSRNPLRRYERPEPIRQEVRRLLRWAKIAEAIDAWMTDCPNAAIAIHKLRIVKKWFHHVDDADGDSWNECGDCCCDG